MADDEGVWLGAVQKTQRDAREGWMEQRALTFDDIPMVGFVVRRDPFGSACDEIRHNGIDGDAAARNEHASLAGGAEFGVEAEPAHLALHGQGGVFLADRAVRADGEQAPAGALRAFAGCEGDVREAHVMQLAAMPRRRGRDFGDGAEPLVQAGRNIEAGVECGDDLTDPVIGQHAAGIGDANHHGLRPLGGRIGDADVGQTGIGLAALQPQLTDAPLRPPVDDALRGLGSQLVVDVAEEKQVGLCNIHVASRHCGGMRPAASASIT